MRLENKILIQKERKTAAGRDKVVIDYEAEVIAYELMF